MFMQIPLNLNDGLGDKNGIFETSGTILACSAILKPSLNNTATTIKWATTIEWDFQYSSRQPFATTKQITQQHILISRAKKTAKFCYGEIYRTFEILIC